MKKLLFFFSLLIPVICFSQTPRQYLGTTTNIVEARGGLMADSSFYLGIHDTTFTPDRIGCVVQRPQNNLLYIYTTLNSSTHWYLLYVASGQVLVSDIPTLPEIKTYTPGVGLAASANYSASYNFASVDSARYYYTTSGTGTENGGWLAAGTSGDSIQVLAPFWVIIGDSQAEGKPALFGRLDANGTGVYVYNYPDSSGQISYHMRALTNMRWYNHGIGGQTTVQVRARFFRDVFADSIVVPSSTPTITLRKRPQGVVIIAGINDIFNGIPIQTIMDNLEWMAAACQTIGTRAVFLNMPGDAVANVDQLKKIAQVNEWMASGVLQKYDACVVDYNSWWNDPDYGYDNIHPTSLIVDDIHPSKVGYDSLANYIFREAKLPVLTKAIFINELSPLGFTGYSRPANITINSDPYTITNATDSINITTFVPDSVWIKINTSTNVTGTTYTGFSHILWKSDNNPLDSTWYTRKALFNSGNISPSLSSLDMIAKTSASSNLMMRMRMADQNEIYRVISSGAGGNFILNGLANTSALSSATLSIYNSGGATIGSNGNIISTGAISQFGNFEIRNNSAPTTTGYGVGTANTASSLNFYGTAAQGRDIFRFSTWNGASSNMNNTSQMSLINLIGTGFQQPANPNSIGNAINIQPAINITGISQTGTVIRGIRFAPTVTSDSSTRIQGLLFLRGNNYLNALRDSTCIGCDSSAFINAKFRVNGTVRIDTMTLPPSTYNVVVHGLTDSTLYQIPSTSISVTTSTISGTTTNDNATAGNIGEYIESNITSGSAVSLTTATPADVTSISLTAGDWDVEGTVGFTITGATTENFRSGSNTTSATFGGDNTYTYVPIIAAAFTNELRGLIPTRRYSLSGTTTIYLIGQANFSAGSVDAYGLIRARRVR